MASRVWYKSSGRIITAYPHCKDMRLGDLVDGMVVGSGSDYIVIQKGKKRIMLECAAFKMQELKSHGTPYGSQFD